MKQTRDTIIKLLSNLGSRAEVEQYLKSYSSLDSQKFAIIKVGGGILSDDLDSLASSLSFLHQVGLFPIVVHGAGPQLNKELEERHIPTRRVNGLRVTDAETLEVARRVFQAENLRLVEALEALGTRARPITSGVFEARLLDAQTYGYVGEIARVHLEPVRSAIRSGALPILTCLGETPAGQIVNINADVAARELAIEGTPYKIVFLTPTGGLLDHLGRLIPSINLAEDYEHLMSQEWVHSGMRLKLQEIKQLLDELPLDSSVSMTSPDQLARELFTHRGSGTLVRRGEAVHVYDSIERCDQDKLRELIEACFGRKLAQDYFTSKPFTRVYVTDSFRATAILTTENGIPYLDKFGVTEKAQGEGIGRSIWMKMRRDYPKLFWRSRRSNPINSWYFQQAEGTYSHGEWTVFWYGFSDDFDSMRACVQRALAMPPTLTDHHVVQRVDSSPPPQAHGDHLTPQAQGEPS